MRVFVAADLPDEVRAGLPAAPDPPWRPVRSEALHITLAFLGHVDPGRLREVTAAVDAATSSPAAVRSEPSTPPEAPPLRLLQSIALPPRRPRVLAVELDDPTGALTALQARISTALQDTGLYTPEPRHFLPHVTIARARGAIAREHAYVDVEPLEFVVPAVTVYRSRTDPAGAVYEPLHRVPLR